AAAGLRHGDEAECSPYRLEWISAIVLRQLTAEAEEQGGGASPGGKQPHAGLHEAHVEFGVRLHEVRVQRHLGATTEGEAEGRYDDRERRAADPRGGRLEGADRLVQIVPSLLPGRFERLGEIGARAERPRILVADDEARPGFLVDEVQG